MAINTIKPFPVLPVIPVRQKDNNEERQRQKKDPEDEEKNNHQEQHGQSNRGNGHIDEFA
ncbi:MAG: hypothetical protein AB8D52_08185 [Gammaproteobacteria bacterium]